MVRVKPWNWGSIPLYGTLPVTSDWEKWVKTPSRRNWEGHWEGQLPQGLSLGRSAGQRLQLRSSQGPSYPSRREARLRADGLCVWGGHRRRQGEASEELTGTPIFACLPHALSPGARLGLPWASVFPPH